jgi:predicted transcriptional regulator of viral defense system
MPTLTDKIIDASFSDHVLTDTDLNGLLDGTAASRYAMVNKALKTGDLIKLRRGLYILNERYRQNKPSKFYLASRMVPHSYVSLESAMSYYGWIPERVTTVTSVHAGDRTKQFASSFGEFVFYRLLVNEFEFLTDIRRIEEINLQPFFIASPLRALMDFVAIKKIDWKGIEYLTIGLRIELDQLEKINRQDFLELKKVYRSRRALHFLESLKKALNK